MRKGYIYGDMKKKQQRKYGKVFLLLPVRWRRWKVRLNSDFLQSFDLINLFSSFGSCAETFLGGAVWRSGNFCWKTASSIKDWQRARGWVIIKSQRRAMKSKDRKSWSILSVSSNVSSRTEEAPGGAQRGNSSYGVTQLHVINNTTKPQNKTCSTDSFNSSSSHFFATTLHCLQDEGNRRWGNKGRGKEKGNK